MPEARLIIRQSGQKEREFVLQGDVSIGRAFDNTLCLEEEGVSRYHALIEKRADRFWLSDLGSTGGTLVNGAPLEGEHQLDEGDVIQIGSANTLSYTANGAMAQKTQPATPAPVEDEKPIETAPAPAPPAPAPAQESISPLYIAAAVGIGLLALSLIAIPIWYLRSGQGSDRSRRQSPPASTPDPAGSRAAQTGSPVTEQVPAPTVNADGGIDVRILAQNLAGQISGKSGTGYVFEPEFAAAIRQRTEGFRTEFIGDARRHRLEINRAFSNAGIPELLGYVLALSQSGFRDSGVSACQAYPAGTGLWRLPREALRAGEDDNAARTPGQDADAAAAYLRNLLLAFDPEDFMYAIACYGAPPGAQGELAKRLDERSADRAARRNFWRMVEAGVVSRTGANQVICFFAAGIVGENPGVFGLSSDRLSSLY